MILLLLFLWYLGQLVLVQKLLKLFIIILFSRGPDVNCVEKRKQQRQLGILYITYSIILTVYHLVTVFIGEICYFDPLAIRCFIDVVAFSYLIWSTIACISCISDFELLCSIAQLVPTDVRRNCIVGYGWMTLLDGLKCSFFNTCQQRNIFTPHFCFKVIL